MIRLLMLVLASIMLVSAAISVRAATIVTETVQSSEVSEVVPVSPGVVTETVRTVATPVLSGGIRVVELPATDSYLVMDPVTGVLRGTYDPVQHVIVGGTLQPGLVVVGRATGRVVAAFDASGRTVEIRSVPASSVLVASISKRRAELERLISDGLNRGTLTEAQAVALRAELEAKVLLGERVVSFGDALTMAYTLNTLGQRVVPITSTVAVTPIVQAPMISMGSHLVVLDAIAFRIGQMESRIETEYLAGRLSVSQVQNLKEDLTKVSLKNARYRKNGTISSSREKELTYKLDKISAEMVDNIAEINEKRARIGIRVD